MPTQIYKLIRLTVLLGPILLMPGCVAVVAAGAGALTYAYIDGDTQGNVPKSPQAVEKAARVVLDRSGARNIERDISEVGRIRLMGEDASGTAISVLIRDKSDASTGTVNSHITVRVGLIGDNDASGMLYYQIRKELGVTD